MRSSASDLVLFEGANSEEHATRASLRCLRPSPDPTVFAASSRMPSDSSGGRPRRSWTARAVSWKSGGWFPRRFCWKKLRTCNFWDFVVYIIVVVRRKLLLWIFLAGSGVEFCCSPQSAIASEVHPCCESEFAFSSHNATCSVESYFASENSFSPLRSSPHSPVVAFFDSVVPDFPGEHLSRSPVFQRTILPKSRYQPLRC